jgi:hypothetical protein
MKYFKCVVAGSAASVLSGIVYVVVSFAVSLSSEWSEDGFAGFGVVSGEFTAGLLLLLAMLAGFAIGFCWMLKRTSSPRLAR